MRKPNSACGCRLSGKQQQRLVERRHQRNQHPDGDAERHPDEQSGDEIALHGCAWRSVARTYEPARRSQRRRRAATSSPTSSRTWLGLDSDFGSDLASVFGFGLDLPSAGPSDVASGRCRDPWLAGLLPEPLKSVAYQPLPFSWKPAAERSLISVVLAARRTHDERRIADISAAIRACGRRTSSDIRRSAWTTLAGRARCARRLLIKNKYYSASSDSTARGAAGAVRIALRCGRCARQRTQSAVCSLSGFFSLRDDWFCRGTGEFFEAAHGRILDLVDRGGGAGRRRAPDGNVLSARGRHRVPPWVASRLGWARRCRCSSSIAGVLGWSDRLRRTGGACGTRGRAAAIARRRPEPCTCRPGTPTARARVAYRGSHWDAELARARRSTRRDAFTSSRRADRCCCCRGPPPRRIRQ